MRTINTTFNTFGASVLLLGYKGDSNATEILIDCAEALEEYEGTMTALSITSPDETLYPGDITLDDNGVVHWIVAERDCSKAGHGSARIDLVNDQNVVVASAEATTIIMKTRMQGIAPDQIADWTEAASVALQELRQELLDLYDGENIAQANEAARQLAESGRVSTEALRVSAENDRETAETLRASAESGRASAEAARVTAETSRASAESTRASAETARASAETARVTEFNTIRTNAQAALSYIGPSESSSTASAAHTKGTYFTYNGNLYQATTDIAAGDTITAGTNCAQVPGGVMGEVSDLKAALGIESIPLLNDCLINTNYTVNVTEINLTPTSSSTGYKCAVIDCVENDAFTINGNGGANPLLWAFVNDQNILIKKSEPNLTGQDLVIVTPANASKLIVNLARNSTDPYIFRGAVTKEQISQLNEKSVALEEAVTLDKSVVGDTNVSFADNAIADNYETRLTVGCYSKDNAMSSTVDAVPFVLSHYDNNVYSELYNQIIDKIRLKVVTAGVLSIGYIPTSKLVQGGSVDEDDITVVDAISTETTGDQIIELNKKFVLPEGCALSFGRSTDTMVFAFGDYGKNKKGFTYKLESTGKYVFIGQSLGVDVFTFTKTDNIVKKINVLENTVGKGTVIVSNGYNDSNNTESVFSASPFILSHYGTQTIDLTGKLVRSIKLKVAQTGFLSYGYVPLTALTSGTVFSQVNYTIVDTIAVSETGEQTITLTKPYYVPSGCAFAIQAPEDSCKFYFGNNGISKGFTYVNESDGKVRYNSGSLGIDVICEYVLPTLNNGLYGKKISFLADSITTFNGYIPSGYDYWYPQGDITNVEQTWWKQLLNETGLVLGVNAAWSGSTATGDSTSTSNAFAGCSTARVTALGTNGTPDIIIVFIGINDFGLSNRRAVGDWIGASAIPNEGTITTFSDAYALMLKKVMTAYPSARVYCCTLMETTKTNYDQAGANQDFPTENTNGTVLEEYNSRIRLIANAVGARIIEMHACGLHHWNTSIYTTDGIHPNAAGAVLLKDCAMHKLLADFV